MTGSRGDYFCDDFDAARAPRLGGRAQDERRVEIDARGTRCRRRVVAVKVCPEGITQTPPLLCARARKPPAVRISPLHLAQRDE